jgi:hypothetical protein
MSQAQILELLNNCDIWLDAVILEKELGTQRTVINRALKQLVRFELVDYQIIKVLRNGAWHEISEYRVKR